MYVVVTPQGINMSHVDMLLQVILVSLKMLNLIGRCPAYREQNNIDWRVNLKSCKAAVSRYERSELGRQMWTMCT